MTNTQKELLEAFRELLAEFGEPVFLDGKKKDAIVSEVSSDESFAFGGVSETGSFRYQIAVEDVAGKPERMTETEIRGKKVRVLSVSNINAVVFEVVAGDPVANDR